MRQQFENIIRCRSQAEIVRTLISQQFLRGIAVCLIKAITGDYTDALCISILSNDYVEWKKEYEKKNRNFEKMPTDLGKTLFSKQKFFQVIGQTEFIRLVNTGITDFSPYVRRVCRVMSGGGEPFDALDNASLYKILEFHLIDRESERYTYLLPLVYASRKIRNESAHDESGRYALNSNRLYLVGCMRGLHEIIRDACKNAAGIPDASVHDVLRNAETEAAKLVDDLESYAGILHMHEKQVYTTEDLYPFDAILLHRLPQSQVDKLLQELRLFTGTWHVPELIYSSDMTPDFDSAAGDPPLPASGAVADSIAKCLLEQKGRKVCVISGDPAEEGIVSLGERPDPGPVCILTPTDDGIPDEKGGLALVPVKVGGTQKDRPLRQYFHYHICAKCGSGFVVTEEEEKLKSEDARFCQTCKPRKPRAS